MKTKWTKFRKMGKSAKSNSKKEEKAIGVHYNQHIYLRTESPNRPRLLVMVYITPSILLPHSPSSGPLRVFAYPTLPLKLTSRPFIR
jgi:hypothetical protein